MAIQSVQSFQNWLNLDIESISWEGRYRAEFLDFWALLFSEETSLYEQIEKINHCLKFASSGPLISWFEWLKRRYMAYTFIFYGHTVKQMANESSVNVSYAASTLRDYFIEQYPHLDEIVNDCFSTTNLVGQHHDLSFSKFSQLIKSGDPISECIEDEVLSKLEVTLFDDWKKLYSELKEQAGENEKVKSPRISTKKFRLNKSFLFETALLFLLGGLFMYGVKYFNSHYEKYLLEQISLFEPGFLGVETNLAFKEIAPEVKAEINLSYKELEELEKLESTTLFNTDTETARYEDESDVVVTSVDSLPKDFSLASLEQSEYEETRKGGYRNTRYGRARAYRVMLSSADTLSTKNKIMKALDPYNLQRADNVAPGTQIPGGLYFNLYVPRDVLKEVLTKVSVIGDATILESKTNYGAPRGTSKVFIWVKSI